MFESLSDKLKRTLKNLRGEGVLTKEHVDAALREIRLALLEADVNYKVAKDFIASVKEKAEGQSIFEKPETNDPLELTRAALQQARDVGYDTLLIDTAGRLHIDDELMEELVSLKSETHPVEILFVADAMTGQDAVRSAEEFHKRIGITGVVLTKMDGDARGGAALSIKQVIGQPVKFVGVGEKYDA